MGNAKGITDLKIDTALDIAAAAAADRSGEVIDMDGWRGVLMCVKFGTIAAGAVTSIKAQQDSASAFNVDPKDLEGTAIAVAADDGDQMFILDIYEPTDRYVRVVVDKDGTNATQETAWYVRYGARFRPTANTVADEVTYERHQSPAEGTA